MQNVLVIQCFLNANVVVTHSLSQCTESSNVFETVAALSPTVREQRQVSIFEVMLLSMRPNVYYVRPHPPVSSQRSRIFATLSSWDWNGFRVRVSQFQWFICELYYLGSV